MIYDNCIKMREDFDPWRQKYWLLHHNTPFVTMEFLTKNAMSLAPTLPTCLTWPLATFRFFPD
jgi:hypothetical protein